MLWCFSLVYENQLSGTKLSYLFDYFASDAACRTRYQDALVLQQFLDGRQVNLYLIAWQQVFNVNFFQLGRRDITFAVPFCSGIHRVDGNAILNHRVHHFRAFHEFIPFQW